jgi:RsiW-degrading membrane proteinase PrsW (M82 family)
MTLLLSTSASVALFLFYIYWRDTKKEPVHLLLKAFVWGCLTVFPVIGLGRVAMQIGNAFGLDIIDTITWQDAFYSSFILAALTEELVKFTCLYLLIWKSRSFDQRFDGIVYAVFVSLGFAFVENVEYVLQGGLKLAWLRAVTSVPAHGIFGVVMGYFFSLARFAATKKRREQYFVAAIFVPVLLHGQYDFILEMFCHVEGWMQLISDTLTQILFFIVFYGFLIILWIVCFKLLNRHIASDEGQEVKTLGAGFRDFLGTKIMKFVSGMVAGMAAVLIGVIIYNMRFGVKETVECSNAISIVEMLNGDFAFKNNETGKIGSARYANVCPPDEEGQKAVLVQDKRGLWGFVSTETGRPVFEPQFSIAWPPDGESNLAACANDDWDIGFVDVAQGTLVIPHQFLFLSSEKIIRFRNGKCEIKDIDGQSGVIDTTGAYLLPCMYDEIFTLDNGMINTVIDDREGLLDSDLHEILPIKYNSIVMDQILIFALTDTTQLILDSDGHLLNTLTRFDNTDFIFCEPMGITQEDKVLTGEPSRFAGYEDNNHYGVKDRLSGQTVIEAQYDAISYVGKGHFVCKKNETAKEKEISILRTVNINGSRK